jgi:hypothetical protein
LTRETETLTAKMENPRARTAVYTGTMDYGGIDRGGST